jgi:hypothetical protein
MLTPARSWLRSGEFQVQWRAAWQANVTGSMQMRIVASFLAFGLASGMFAASALAWSSGPAPSGAGVGSQFTDPDAAIDSLANAGTGGSGAALDVETEGGAQGAQRSFVARPMAQVRPAEPQDAEPVNPAWPLWMQWHQQ